jgi:hypothetical protein
MNIVKRLLNVFLLTALLIFLVGLADGVGDYKNSLDAREAACKKQIALEKAALNPPFKKLSDKKYLYTINGKRVETDTLLNQADIKEIRSELSGEMGDPVLTEARNVCNGDLSIFSVLESEDYWAIPLMICLLIFVLNYILFGKVTLWNSVSGSERAEK